MKERHITIQRKRRYMEWERLELEGQLSVARRLIVVFWFMVIKCARRRYAPGFGYQSKHPNDDQYYQDLRAGSFRESARNPQGHERRPQRETDSVDILWEGAAFFSPTLQRHYSHISKRAVGLNQSFRVDRRRVGPNGSD